MTGKVRSRKQKKKCISFNKTPTCSGEEKCVLSKDFLPHEKFFYQKEQNRNTI